MTEAPVNGNYSHVMFSVMLYKACLLLDLTGNGMWENHEERGEADYMQKTAASAPSNCVNSGKM